MNGCASTEAGQRYSEKAFKDIKKAAEARANLLRQRLPGPSLFPSAKTSRLLQIRMFGSVRERQEP